MNILIFDEASWDDRNSFGNTVSNFFCGKAWNDDNFCNFYARKKKPDNKANVSYYNLSATDIVKVFLKFKIKGTFFTSNDLKYSKSQVDFSSSNEQKRIDKLHANKNEFIYWGHEQIWRSRLWLNKYFKKFIKDNNPDILFAFATSPYILWPIIKYLKKNTECKVVLLIADEVYGSYKNYAFYRRGYLKRELKKCIMAADKLYGISDEMSELYSNRFNKAVTTLYKGCDLSLPPKGYLNPVLRFVYAGNLFWGRDDTLSKVADAIEKINKNGLKATLEIYTGASITEQLKNKLNRGESSKIMGPRSYDEIKHIMHEADVVLHVESFDEKSIETVKYSFSTKIIDCLQSGSQILGVGPSGIASIEYLKKVDGAMVITTGDEIEEKIMQIVSSPEKMLKNIEQTYKYALERHDIVNVQSNLKSEFENIG